MTPKNTPNDIIRGFIIENFLFEDTGELHDTTSFLEQGVIDSTGILELIDFIERTFGVQAMDDDLVPENFDSIVNIVQFIEHKKSQSS